MGAWHTCAVEQGGRGLCWGRNNVGNIGDGTLVQRLTPTPVSGLSNLRAIAAGGNFSCGLTAAGALSCWGFRGLGAIGDGSSQTSSAQTPVPVLGLSSGVAAVAAGSQFACALTAAGAVLCWGDNGSGQLGDGRSGTTTSRSTPGPVSGLGSGVVAIAAGGSHACAVLATGGVRCWGSNSFGMLGDGTEVNRLTPTPVSGLTNAVSVSASNGQTCAVTAGGGALCWGWNANGRLGIGNDNIASVSVPTPVVGLSSGVRSVSVGYQHACAVRTSGAVLCWGNNINGQVGTGINTQSGTFQYASPTPVVGLASGVASVAAGFDNTCALLQTGALRCWGLNQFGEHGDGTTTRHLSPVAVSGSYVFVGPADDAPGPAARTARVYPALTAGAFRIDVDVPASGTVRVTLHDMLGRTVRIVHDAGVASGRTAIAGDVRGLPPGPYVVRVSAGAWRSAHRVTVVR